MSQGTMRTDIGSPFRTLVLVTKVGTRIVQRVKTLLSELLLTYTMHEYYDSKSNIPFYKIKYPLPTIIQNRL